MNTTNATKKAEEKILPLKKFLYKCFINSFSKYFSISDTINFDSQHVNNKIVVSLKMHA